MPRSTEDEREALKQAALAVTPVLERLRRQREALDARVAREREALSARIARLENIVASADEAAGKRPKQIDDAEGSRRIRRGQAAGHIDAVLRAGGDYAEPELRKQITERFGMTYSRASIYTVLRRGKDTKYELKDGKRWRMKSDA